MAWTPSELHEKYERLQDKYLDLQGRHAALLDKYKALQEEYTLQLDHELDAAIERDLAPDPE